MVTFFVSTIVKIAIMVGFLINVAALLTWFDRRGGGMIQDRVGPNRALLKIGKFELRIAGLLHTAADGLKFFFKEDFIPPKADKLLFALAPMLCLAPVLALSAVIPFADTLCLGPDIVHKGCAMGADGEHLKMVGDTCVNMAGSVVAGITPGSIWPPVNRLGVCVTDVRNGVFPIDMMVAPLNVGLLYVFAIAGQGIVGAAIAGWASDNKFSLMGALRAASQMVSYEVGMGLSLIGAMMIYGTIRLDDMVRWQGEHAWGIFVQPFAFFLFFASAIAESKRIPFDLPEAESELVSGYFTEYSGMKFGMFYFSEYMEVVTSSMLLVTLFLGGWQLPFLHRDGITIAFGDATLFHMWVPHIWMTILGVVAFFGKVLVLCVFQAFIRWSLPRFRYDQLMKLGWRVLLPASLANLCATGILYLAADQAGAAVQSGLRIAGDVSQAVVALLITALVLRAIIGFFSTKKRIPWIVGTSARLAAAAGGSKTGEMGA